MITGSTSEEQSINENEFYWLEHRYELYNEYEERSGLYKKITDYQIQQLEKAFQRRKLKALVKGRVKSFDAFHRKLLVKSQAQHIERPFEELTDLVGLRVVVPFLEDVAEVESLMQKMYTVTEVEHKSRELSRREFGYDSLHLLLQVEVPEEYRESDSVPESVSVELQIRTILQDAWAEVEHELVYKTSIDKVEDTIRRKLHALNATLSLADTIFQEIRDYQKKRYDELKDRHHRLMEKVSTIPEKAAQRFTEVDYENEDESDLDDIASSSRSLNNLLVEAMNAHLENRLEKALELYSRLLVMSPNHYIYNHRGLVFLSLSQYEKAHEDFSTAIEMEPGDIRVYTNRGLTRRMMKMFDEALEDFNTSLELNPLWPDTFYGRALTWYDMGNISEAVRDCDKAISLNPEFKQAVRFKQFLMNQQ